MKDNIPSSVDNSCGQCVGHLFENVDPGGPGAILEVLVQVQVVAVDAVLVLLSLTDHVAQGQDVGADKVPLVVGVVLEHLESFADSVLNATQTAQNPIGQFLIFQ